MKRQMKKILLGLIIIFFMSIYMSRMTSAKNDDVYNATITTIQYGAGTEYINLSEYSDGVKIRSNFILENRSGYEYVDDGDKDGIIFELIDSVALNEVNDSSTKTLDCITVRCEDGEVILEVFYGRDLCIQTYLTGNDYLEWDKSYYVETLIDYNEEKSCYTIYWDFNGIKSGEKDLIMDGGSQNVDKKIFDVTKMDVLTSRSCGCRGLHELYCWNVISNVFISGKASSVNYDAKSMNNGVYEYSLLNDGTAEITKYLGFDKVINIPSVVNGIKITSIGQNAFQRCERIVEVTIPESITSIGNSAFNSCTGMKEVTIHEGVTSIGEHAFSSCDNLKKINIPKSVTNIGRFAFSMCPNLSEVNIHEDINTITGEYIFTQCYSIKQINIPRGFKISYGMFMECNGLVEFVIPDGVTTVEPSVFEYCGNLKKVTIPDSVIKINYRVFSECKNLTDVYYMGSKTSWNNIYIVGDGNGYLKTAKLHILVEEPTTEDPTTEDPTTEEPTTEEPTTEEPTTEEPTTEEPTTEEPTTEEPTTEEPTTEEPTSKESTTEEPTTEAPTTDKNETTEVITNTDSITDQIKDSEDKNVEIKNTEAIKLDKNVFESMKKENKNLVYSVVDKDNKLEYSWTFDSSVVKDTNVSVDLKMDKSDKNDKVEKHIKNDDVLYLNFAHHGKLPGDATINVRVDDKFTDGVQVNLYYYDEEADKVFKAGNRVLTVKSGYVEFTISHCSTYFITEEELAVELDPNSPQNDNNDGITEDNLNMKIVICLVVVSLVLLAVFVVVYFKRVKSVRK